MFVSLNELTMTLNGKSYDVDHDAFDIHLIDLESEEILTIKNGYHELEQECISEIKTEFTEHDGSSSIDYDGSVVLDMVRERMDDFIKSKLNAK